MEIMTVSELAALLKMSKRAIYELTQERTGTGDLAPADCPA